MKPNIRDLKIIEDLNFEGEEKPRPDGLQVSIEAVKIPFTMVQGS